MPVLNDAQAALLGEVWKGAAEGTMKSIQHTRGEGQRGRAGARHDYSAAREAEQKRLKLEAGSAAEQ